jgi:mycofactocin precursor
LSQGAKLSRPPADRWRSLARGEENRMSSNPEQLEQTSPELESDEATATPSDDKLVLEDLLVEDVSIDGMCGVY